jgi:tryptophanase
VFELLSDEATNADIDLPFKGNIDIPKLRRFITENGKNNIAFIRIEAGTNLIGCQPVALSNMEEVCQIAKESGILSVFDASLLSDNLYFIKTLEKQFENVQLNDITKEIANLFDIVYFSARKLGCARGGAIITKSKELFGKMAELVPMFEGFLTYGGMSVREMEALAVGLYESLDIHVIEQTPIFVKKMTEELNSLGVPVVTPSGGLGCHLNAMKFCEHCPVEQYRAGSLAVAAFVARGIRGMERGTMSEDRNNDGTEKFAALELLRLAFPKRVFTLSQVKYIADRIGWLYENRKLIGGLRFIEEPTIMRFFFGRLDTVGNWIDNLVGAFRKDFGCDSL